MFIEQSRNRCPKLGDSMGLNTCYKIQVLYIVLVDLDNYRNKECRKSFRLADESSSSIS